MKKELKVIENELVPVYETNTGEKVIYGSELHRVLEARTPYKDWSERRLKECDAVENEDFQAAQICAPSGQKMKEHIIKLDTGKEMAMLEHNEKGKQVRRYFIQVEKKYGESKKLSATEQLRLQNQAILEVDEKVDAVNEDLQEFKRDMPLLALECQRITWAKNHKVVPLLGGKNAPAYKDGGLRSRVYRDLEAQLRREFGVNTYKAIKRSQCDLAIQIIEEYELPMALVEEIEESNSQVELFEEEN